MNYPDSVENEFRRLYGDQPLIVRSPGRVNLIGEHTDYNLGFVLPAAIDKAIYFAVAPRKDHLCRLHAIDVDDDFEFSLEALGRTPKGWPNFLMGVVDQVQKQGHTILGFNCAFGGDIPIGAGVSSSAALEAGLAFALNRIFALGMDRLSLVKLAQKAENDFVGVRCGIMDQYANVFGLKNNVLRIDCRSLEHVYCPFDSKGVSIVLFDTRVSRSLASSAYNRRREECAEGVTVIHRRYPEVASLRDATAAMLAACAPSMTETVSRRCKYVVEENQRVLSASGFLQNGDLRAFGSLLKQTHDGLRDYYEVSCRELDFLVDAVRDDPHVHGARLMGAGFGGCTINVVLKNGVEEVCNKTAEKYKEEFGIDLQAYVMSIGSGTSEVDVRETVAL
ncbi:MAG TPA: galactokinase [Bacteroidota bacterium]|nr:galactokinase [Bacteroidota bacterium]